MPPPDQLLQKHFANLGHVRDVFQIDPRVEAGPAQVAPWLSRIVQLVHPAFPGAFQFSDPEVRAFANPAAGAEFVVTVPPNEAWAIRCVRARFACSAAVANRQFELHFDDSVNTFFVVVPTQTQVASQDFTYNYGRAMGYEKRISNQNHLGLPDFVMDTGWRIRSSTISLQVADQFSEITLLVDIFPR